MATRYFRSSLYVMPGGLGGPRIRRLGTPEPQGAIFAPTLEEKRRVRQEKLFAEAIGGTAKQLGLEGLRAEGSTYLRPEQVAALIALRRGEDPVRVLGGGGPSQVSSMPSRSAASAGRYSSELPIISTSAPESSQASGGLTLPRPGILIGLAVAGALGLLLLRRKR